MKEPSTDGMMGKRESPTAQQDGGRYVKGATVSP